MKHEKLKTRTIAFGTALALGSSALAGCQISEDVNTTYYFKAVCDDKKAEPIIYKIEQYEPMLNKKAHVWVTCANTNPENDVAIRTTLIKDQGNANVAIDVTYNNGFLENKEPKVNTVGHEISFDRGTITSAQIIE